jgi:hypothetical protein
VPGVMVPGVVSPGAAVLSSCHRRLRCCHPCCRRTPRSR